jgi:hypothetical protein
MKCDICKHQITIDCNYNQGRCPHKEPMFSKPYPTWLLLLAAPFIIGGWMIMNPKKVWEQAKKDYNL